MHSGRRQGAGPAGAKPLGAGGKPNSNTPMKLTPEMIERLRNASARGQRMSISDIAKPQAPGAPGGPGGPGRGQDSRSGPGSAARIAGRPQQPAPGSDEEDEEKKKAGPGRVIGSDSRHKGRTDKGRQGGPARRSRFRRHRHRRAGRDNRRAVRLPTRSARRALRKAPAAASSRSRKIEGPVEISPADHRPQPVRSDRHEGRRTVQAAPEGDRPALRLELGDRLRRRRRSSPSRRTSS